MIGRRIQHVEGKDLYDELEHPGDYCGPLLGFSGERPAVFFIVPASPPWMQEHSIKHLVHCVSPPHVFRECDDGSLEIRESILVTQRWADKQWVWHGYLDQGHNWRTV